jgi:hypothetical protein
MLSLQKPLQLTTKGQGSKAGADAEDDREGMESIGKCSAGDRGSSLYSLVTSERGEQKQEQAWGLAEWTDRV